MPITKAANSHANVKQSTSADSQGSAQALSRLIAIYDAVVGSSLQVSSGVATHTSLQAAVNYVTGLGGGSIYVLNVTLTENVTISTTGITVSGKGHTAMLNGNLTVSANYNDVSGIRVSGNIGVSGNNNYLRMWMSSTSTFSDTGLANSSTISQE